MTAVGRRYDTCHSASVSRVSERDGLRSLRRYTRLTLLASLPMVGVAPLLATFANGDVHWARLPVLVVGVVVFLTMHWKRVARAIEVPTEVAPWRRSAVTLAASLVLLTYAYVYADPGNSLWAFVTYVAVAEFLYGRSPATAWLLTACLAVGVGAWVAALTAFAPGVDGDLLPPAIVTSVVLFVMPFTELIAHRQWRIALELDQARRDAAELGATRERLRFAEDLHDILGHALEVVSLKSELATRLVAVDPSRAQAEMVEVQRLARGALRDVRQLARGRRSTDLDTELSGARTLLASAGIDCVVDGAPSHGRHDELLGRVLREAVTNLLRHADTRQCWITVRPAALTVVNDGVDTERPAGDGTGLLGLRRRATESGGSLTAGPGELPGTFQVAAVLP
jgi:two-component system, NarL family, sensor histidine kinase DesK